MRSSYLLLVFCGTGSVAGLVASQAQVESKELAQERLTPEQLLEAAQQRLKKADGLILGTAAEQKKAFEDYRLIANIAEDRRKDLHKTGLRDELWDRIASVARSNVGYCYERGAGVAADPKLAFTLYKEAVELGDLSLWWNYPAMFNKARCYARGIGIEKNRAEALKLFKLAKEWYEKFLKINPLLRDQSFEAAIGARLGDSYSEGAPMVAISVQPFREEPIELGEFHKLDEKMCRTA